MFQQQSVRLTMDQRAKNTSETRYVNMTPVTGRGAFRELWAELSSEALTNVRTREVVVAIAMSTSFHTKREHKAKALVFAVYRQSVQSVLSIRIISHSHIYCTALPYFNFCHAWQYFGWKHWPPSVARIKIFKVKSLIYFFSNK